MSAADTPPPTKAEARRLQIVRAAIGCFESGGFHSTSMSQIAEAAGMSVGHIYHYFPGKEALIAAIVEVKVAETLQRMNAAAEKASLFDVLVARAGDCVETSKSAGERALFYEVAAESERNPKIAEMMRNADAGLVERQRALFNELAPELAQLGAAEVTARIEVFNTLMLGLMLRQAFQPDACDDAVCDTVNRVLRSLIGQ